MMLGGAEMETPIVVPLWASVVFRAVGSLNLFLSMFGLDAMLGDLSSFLANPVAHTNLPPSKNKSTVAFNPALLVVLRVLPVKLLKLSADSLADLGESFTGADAHVLAESAHPFAH